MAKLQLAMAKHQRAARTWSCSRLSATSTCVMLVTHESATHGMQTVTVLMSIAVATTAPPY